ncbi:glycosyltransferase family 4 protein [Variovorax saccharolyticus]|uniref:glycosyltransferase family 4 protein n=1 Tax=Variovorax saccharolyticus TaxID=3053516 RepID=UPI002577B30F|nr:MULTISPECIES: glycosyltransferase family 4 protein [unclassified Variovorax]MDM0016140.1 glycosyltransferase family 4 protein [Variovorax sp. J22R187]MDM0027065.1 glycosyltransferase family 4 protein [Variovorax sp. J31P216]
MNARCSFLVPGDLGTRTGGYGYDRRIIEGLRAAGWQVEVQSLGPGYPDPGQSALASTRRVVEALADDTLVVVDGLAFGVMAEVAAAHARRLRWVALVHHPLSLETGLAPERQRALFESERQALATARGVIVTSPATARALAAFDVAAARIAVVEPGTDPAALAQGSGSAGLVLLCIATVTPRKGHAVLVEALAGLRDRPWTLLCAGSLTMDAACSASLAASIEAHGLKERVRLLGECDEPGLRALYAAADVFVLPSFHEGYGMALAEALAHGLPVVSTRAGAIPDTVPATAGLLVAPGDVDALRGALQQVLDDAGLRARLAEGAREARRSLPTWDDSAARFAAALRAARQAPLA